MANMVPCAQAAEEEQNTASVDIPRHYSPSTNLLGTLGLNTIPNARMDETGTIRLGLSTSDPYVHGFLGFQMTKALYLNARYSAQVSNLRDDADSFHPGLDIKLRLAEETATRPAIVLGMDASVGDKRLASEYLAFSKRFHNFDVTGGIAWGRLGSAGHIKNPMRSLSSHFDARRNYNTPYPQDPNNWFTGEDIGFFGGVEYFTPINGLSVKADYGANDYIGEQEAIRGFNAPEPWSISLNYKPWEQVDLSAGIIGGEKIMARLSLQNKLSDLPVRAGSKPEAPALTAPRQNNADGSAVGTIALSAHQPVGRQIGHRARNMANAMPASEERVAVNLRHKGLRGPKVTLIRHELENAVLNNYGSPEELWHSKELDVADKKKFHWKNALKADGKILPDFRFILDNKLSISESYAGLLYRSSALIETEKQWPLGIVTGASARINIKDNLHRIKKFRLPLYQGVRSDEFDFAARGIAIDRLYTSWLQSLTPSTHIGITAGFLEEMYSGLGGEILYRPFGKTFAVGAESWLAKKRDPFSTLNRDSFKENIFSGHVNLFYELPNTDFTVYAKAGQYLGEDRGGTLGIRNRFENGTSLEGYVTVTNLAYRDIFDHRTHTDGGIKLNIPLGNIPFIPDGSAFRLRTGPLARTVGQVIDHPQPLYEVTEPVSYRRLSQSWKEVLD